jgi:hypothetical protein
MSGRVIGFIVLTAILAIARAAPEDAETYVTAIGTGIMALCGLVVRAVLALMRW